MTFVEVLSASMESARWGFEWWWRKTEVCRNWFGKLKKDSNVTFFFEKAFWGCYSLALTKKFLSPPATPWFFLWILVFVRQTTGIDFWHFKLGKQPHIDFSNATRITKHRQHLQPLTSSPKIPLIPFSLTFQTLSGGNRKTPIPP